MSDDFSRRPPPGFPPCSRLIVNADDFGLSTRINEGIVRAHQQGIVTSTSLMAGGRAFDHGVQCWRDTPTLDIGAHLTVVAERPVLGRPSSLTGADGRFPSSAGAFLGRFLSGAIRRADVAAEWAAQIECILDQGIRVTHLDSHQHLHILPGLADLAWDLAARYSIPFVRVPVENPLRGQWASRRDFERILGATALGVCWTLARLTGAGTLSRRAPSFLGFHAGGRLDNSRLERLLRTLQPGRTYELMCHPGLRPDEPEIVSWGYGHEGEMHALTNPAIRSVLTARNIRLCSFAELAKM